MYQFCIVANSHKPHALKLMRFKSVEKTNVIKLDQFLKLMGVTATGGQAKWMIQGGDVQVNGVLETRRGRQLAPGDQVTVGDKTFEVDESIK